MGSDSDSGKGEITAFVKKLCGLSTQDEKTADMLPTVLNLNATQQTVSNQNNIPSLRDTSNTAKHSFSIINKDVDTDFNVKVTQ